MAIVTPADGGDERHEDEQHAGRPGGAHTLILLLSTMRTKRGVEEEILRVEAAARRTLASWAHSRSPDSRIAPLAAASSSTTCRSASVTASTPRSSARTASGRPRSSASIAGDERGRVGHDLGRRSARRHAPVRRLHPGPDHGSGAAPRRERAGDPRRRRPPRRRRARRRRVGVARSRAPPRERVGALGRRRRLRRRGAVGCLHGRRDASAARRRSRRGPSARCPAASRNAWSWKRCCEATPTSWCSTSPTTTSTFPGSDGSKRGSDRRRRPCSS